MQFPSLAWCRNALHYNPFSRLNRKIWKVETAYVVGSVAKGTARPDSDLDIALVLVRRDGKTPRFSSLKTGLDYHANFRRDSQKPHWNGQVVDFDFYYPNDTQLEGYTKIPIS